MSLYPPLCFVDSTYAVVPDSSKEVLRQSLDAADYQALLIRQPEVHVRIRSKFLDLLKKDSSVTEGRNSLTADPIPVCYTAVSPLLYSLNEFASVLLGEQIRIPWTAQS